MVTICVYAKLNILHTYQWAWTSMLYFTTSNQLNDSLVETKCKLISISYGASYYAMSLASKVTAFASRNACTLAAWSYASLVFSIAMGSSAPRALTGKGTASPLKRPNPIATEDRQAKGRATDPITHCDTTDVKGINITSGALSMGAFFQGVDRQ